MGVKLNILVFFLLAMSVFVSCSVPDVPDDGVISPVSAPDNVSAFFEEHLPDHSQSLGRADFKFSDREFSESECFLVNSKSEFKDVVADGVKVPDIDFKRYSLIIGQCVLGDPGYVLEKQVVYPGENDMELRLVYRTLDGVSPGVATNFYFWGLYPKLPDIPLEVEMDII